MEKGRRWFLRKSLLTAAGAAGAGMILTRSTAETKPSEIVDNDWLINPNKYNFFQRKQHQLWN
ncbi:MAG TPA: hypothetical protein VF828_03380, partial [Patescibacteria group bacterium]